MIKDLIEDEKPREKFLKFGANSLTDVELVAIILRTGLKGYSVLDVSRDVIKTLKKETLYYLGQKDVDDLTEINGIGKAKAITICAAIELGRRITQAKIANMHEDFSNPQAVASYVMEEYRNLKQECFSAAYLSTKNKLIAIEKLTFGSINSSIAEPREVFSKALKHNAAKIILIHNHPSGDTTASNDDILLTRKMVAAGEIMNVKVLDHIIIGDGIYSSLLNENLI